MVLLDVYGADGSLFVNGVPLSIKGVNWFGSESYGGPPGGLTVHTIDFYLDFLQEHKFNALRLLFNHQSVMRDAVVEAPPNLLDDLREVRYIEQFSLLARAAAAGGGKLGKLGMSFGGKGPKEATTKPAKEEKEVELD